MGGKARNGRPAIVRTAGKGGILRIDFGEGRKSGAEWMGRVLPDLRQQQAGLSSPGQADDGAISRFNKFVISATGWFRSPYLTTDRR
jgi:hypothetical protein